VDFGAELRDEQACSASRHQPDPSAVQLQRHGAKQPITTVSGARRLAGLDLELRIGRPRPAGGRRPELRGRTTSTSISTPCRAFAIHDARLEADRLGVVRGAGARAAAR
jgi:hypothetical protein